MSPLRGEKRIFGLLGKNNTGMAALRAGLPVARYRPMLKETDLFIDTKLFSMHKAIKHAVKYKKDIILESI